MSDNMSARDESAQGNRVFEPYIYWCRLSTVNYLRDQEHRCFSVCGSCSMRKQLRSEEASIGSTIEYGCQFCGQNNKTILSDSHFEICC